MPQIIINNNGLDLEKIEKMHKNQVECDLCSRRNNYE